MSFSNYLRSFGDYFSAEGRKQMQEAKEFVSSSNKGKWDELPEKLKNPAFVRQVRASWGTDNKLKTHVKSLSDLNKSKSVTKITGSKGTEYTIKSLGNGAYGCTCKDWKYKGSVNPGYECKHIKAFKEGKTKVSYIKTSNAFVDELHRVLKTNHPKASCDGESHDVTTNENAYIHRYPHQFGLEDPEIILRRLY